MTNDEIPMMWEREAGEPDFVGKVGVGFGLKPVQKGTKDGVPFFQDKVFIKVVTPGDDKCVSERIINDKDKLRFPQAWAAFQARETKPIDGFPLEEWPQLTRSDMHYSKSKNIYTVEMLAGVDDSRIDNMGYGYRELRTKAKAFLVQAKDTEAAQKIAAENDRLK